METICYDCKDTFKFKTSEKKKLIFREPDEYICHSCYEQRLNCEFRIYEGIYLCSNSDCVRNKMAFSNFCEICDRNFI